MLRTRVLHYPWKQRLSLIHHTLTANARVYAGDDDGVPPHPGKDWTRFVCISDTHSKTFPVPAGDILLHSGDLTSWGYFYQLEKTIEWLRSLSHPTKIIIAGNHDFCLDKNWIANDASSTRAPSDFEKDGEQAQAYIQDSELVHAGVHYLQYEMLKARGPSGREWTVFGSPGSPEYGSGAFQYSREEARAIAQKIPSDTEILLTHSPPYLTLDQTRNGVDAGCRALRWKLDELAGCRLHVFGHIHEAHGAVLVGEGVNGEDTGRVAVNASLYGVRFGKAIVVDLKN